MSGDRRVRRTRRLVQEALVALILEKGYDAVTVTDVIARADVGRSTFYAHFADKQDVLFSSLDELSFLRPAPVGEGGGLFAFSLPMFEHAREQRRLVRALLGRGGGGNRVVARGERLLTSIVTDELLAAGARPSPALDLLATCVVGAFMALLRAWADGETTATPAELDAAFRAAVEPGARAALDQTPAHQGRPADQPGPWG
ncbi:Transcriptional regulator, TetR family [Nonomuraea coxensis DSM 45129]|uniref:Transcriptional regulator, TetR family n=1 Tax=Nonomuraea coxensis DSM 45129 TaxID=1122611 RepID=A0ABX8U5S1_9ACTN|nr:TetR/AcrR family transcriptional regulator [Nonomuraea coxensis]QYC42459.1 Transcriptional regulator, TetR family [Nonomuraea coxensis DSM 45129]